MVKLKYIGEMATGMCVCSNFRLPVKVGEVYEIPDGIVERLLLTSSWEKVKEVKVIEKKKDKKEEEIGGNKKW